MQKRRRCVSDDESSEELTVLKRMRRKAQPLRTVAAPVSDAEAELRLTADQMADLKHDVYTKCARKRKNFGWAKCPKEILDPLIERMMVMARATPDDVFLDIGSGVGNVVETVATRIGCRSIGVELVRENYAVSVEAAPHFAQHRQDTGLANPECRVEYLLGDVRKHWASLRDDVSIIWMANKFFPMEVDCFLLDAIETLKPGTRIFTMKDLVLHTDPECESQRERCQYYTFEEIRWGADDVEWTQKPGVIHMYTRTDVIRQDEEQLSQGYSVRSSVGSVLSNSSSD
eukprot:TRINITY_DN51521_c0_g1_i1.p2 TRINITY_DN51521_c0_g1~~TRINITY_DN51521_c0_g1_i1.p2  ORF type:complete len:322 (+),score=144.12 TRINITY_DN51521_c0_g1_i1:106-966(+)